jgi:hypothetical protein
VETKISVLYDSIEGKTLTNIPLVFHVQHSFNTSSEFNLIIGLYIMLYYSSVYFTTESGTFFCDVLCNPVHNECQARKFEL